RRAGSGVGCESPRRSMLMVAQLHARPQQVPEDPASTAISTRFTAGMGGVGVFVGSSSGRPSAPPLLVPGLSGSLTYSIGTSNELTLHWSFLPVSLTGMPELAPQGLVSIRKPLT